MRRPSRRQAKRASVQARQQGAQTRLVSICLRGLERPRLTGLLRTQGPAGKRHNQALIALALRRRDVLFARLRDGPIYQPKSAPNA